MDKKNNNPLALIQLNNYVKPVIKEEKTRGFVTNGKNNSYFYYVNDRYIGSPTNAAIINGYISWVYGKGLAAKDQMQKPQQYARLYSILKKKDVKRVVADYVTQGMAYLQITRNRDNTINSINHIAVDQIAPEIANEDNVIEAYYYSSDFSDRQIEPQRIPAFGVNTRPQPLEIYCIKPYQLGMEYFALPSYQSGLQYCELEEEISNFTIKHMQNGLSFGTIISIPDGYNLEDEQKAEIERKIKQKLTGSNNAGKVIIDFANGENRIEVTPIEVNDAHSQWEFLSQESQSKIITAHEVVSPMLFGIKDASGFSNNADELAEAERQTIERVVNPKQNDITDAFEDILSTDNITLDLFFKPLNERKEVTVKTELNSQLIELESFTDYPQGAVNNAKRALEWADKNGWGSCGTPVGKQRANQLANREPISLETVKRMAAFRRHQQNKDTPYSEGCGKLMWDAWGGDAGIRWAETKVKSLELSTEICCSAEEKTPSAEITDLLISLGEDDSDKWQLLCSSEVDYDTDDDIYNIINLATSTGVARPNANSEQDSEDIKIRYRYVGNPRPQRDFCVKMMKANKLYRKEDILQMERQGINDGFGLNGTDSYSIWLWKGGGKISENYPNGTCKHKWQREIYLKVNGNVDVNSPLAKTITTTEARRKGYKVPANPSDVSITPHNNK